MRVLPGKASRGGPPSVQAGRRGRLGPRSWRRLAGLATLLLPLALAQAEDEPWSPLAGPLPGAPAGPFLASPPVVVFNQLLQKIKEKLYEVPWAPGEAVLLEARSGVSGLNAFGLWNGPDEYQLLVRQGRHWRLLTPAGTTAAEEPRLAYFGHEVTGQPVVWTGPARLVVAGPAGAAGVVVSRVPLFEAGCTLLVLERAERELRQAHEFLGWLQPERTGLWRPRPAALDVVRSVAECQARIDATRTQLRQQTQGLLDTYQALPEPRYALENLAFFSRLYQRSQGFAKIGDADLWTRVFYGRPEFAPCVAARKAAQEALWAQRPQTLAAETAKVFGRRATFGASITHGLVKFRRDRPFPEPLRTRYGTVLAREEYESFQVVVAALAQPLSQVRVSATWQGPGPHPEVILRPVGYVETQPDPDNLAEYVGWWPDPLLAPGPVDVAAGETQPIWGTVRAAKDTPAGEHIATVTVEALGQPPVRLELSARVLDVNLGFTHLPSLLSLRLDTIRTFYKLDTVTSEIRRRWYAFCLDYRMNPNDIYSSDFYPQEEDLDFCIERGFNAMVITTPPLSRTTRNRTANLQVWVSDDNQSFRQLPSGYSVSHDAEGSLVVAGFDVTARYLKLHSTLADDAYEFALKTLAADRIVAHDGDQPYSGPAGYAGSEDGSQPLLSFGATWGAALDYRNSSLGVDLGQPRHVTRLTLRGAYGATRERVRRFYEVAKAHGLGDRAYVYGFDEWGDVSRYGTIKDTYDELKALAPGIKACSTVVHPVPPIEQTIDAWCPALCYEFPEYRQARQRGQEVWYYEGGCPYDPYPTHELLDVPAVEARAFFWVAWRYQYTGWLHWELNVWTNNLEGDKRWPEVPWNPARSGVRNGEVGRIYPGPDASPLPSVRLENMRDGIEDYDTLWLLRERARQLPPANRQRLAAEALIRDATLALCPSRAHFERDPVVVLAWHRKLGLMLERLSH
jgi:hypothetical protein